MTVPTGIDSISAISAYENSSTSRNQTAWRNASGSASIAAWSSGASVSRSSSVSGVSAAPAEARPAAARRRPVHDLAVDRHRVARAVAGAVPGGVVEDREQPGPQVRARLEAIRGAKRLEIGFLHQILGVRRHAGQPQRRPIQAVDRRQRLGLERAGDTTLEPCRGAFIPALRALQAVRRAGCGKPVQRCPP